MYYTMQNKGIERSGDFSAGCYPHRSHAACKVSYGELFQAYIDMEEEMVARAEVDALAREEQQAALEMGL